jgi:putrescine:ornithine antiporter
MPDSPKKMNLMQLTVIVAVNMMGSGIIMLPTNMAQVGAISLLSWGVTAVGSMAIAWGFAQAGVLNQRNGGMSAYAEEAYGKSGFFMVFYLYFFSLAIGNVAIAISAVGYLATFFPGMSATPIATCASVIALIWLTTVANFGGPKVTGRIGAITVWGVIIPVAGLSLIGWFWFKGATFEAAWNPKGMKLIEGVGSSISLTLWAFLGMESAAQNSDAVENPKRNVPLACMLGTLGAAVIYVLSTTVIQGIVPNEELAKSTGPFGLVYAKMFSPTVGSIIMALAIMACLGSLLGWQFTIAQTAKSAAEDRMFPSFFATVTGAGAPIIGMIVMGVVQSLMALSTISPSLSEQFSVLVNLAVVTNVVPYIIALSALIVMMQKAGVGQGTYRTNVAISLVATLYSVYAIYASGASAVLGGTIVMGLGFVIYGFLAPRFELRGAATAVLALVALGAALPANAGTLDRVKERGKLVVGHRADARPFSYEESGRPTGYSLALCDEVIEAVKSELALPGLTVEHVTVTVDERFDDVESGKVDLLCGADTVTLRRRKQVAFSIPIFSSGIGAVLRADAPERLKAVLEGRPEPFRPRWRASLAQVLESRTLSATEGTTAASWLAKRREALEINAKIANVASYKEGIDRVLAGTSDAFFGDRAILLDAATRGPSADQLVVLSRRYTYEPIALVFARNDDDFRLLVDTALSRLYRSPKLAEIYARWFGKLDDTTSDFLRTSALPE